MRTKCLEREEREINLKPCPGALSQHEKWSSIISFKKTGHFVSMVLSARASVTTDTIQSQPKAFLLPRIC